MRKPLETTPLPSVHPATLLALIRTCVPDADYIDEVGLRALMPELDAHLAAYIRAVGRGRPLKAENLGLEAAA